MRQNLLLWPRYLGACILAMMAGQVIEFTMSNLLGAVGSETPLLIANLAGMAVVIMLYSLLVFAVVVIIATLVRRELAHPQLWIILSAVLGRYLAFVGLPQVLDGIGTAEIAAAAGAFGNLAISHVLVVYMLPALLFFHLLRRRTTGTGGPVRLSERRRFLATLVLATVLAWEVVAWGYLLG